MMMMMMKMTLIVTQLTHKSKEEKGYLNKKEIFLIWTWPRGMSRDIVTPTPYVTWPRGMPRDIVTPITVDVCLHRTSLHKEQDHLTHTPRLDV